MLKRPPLTLYSRSSASEQAKASDFRAATNDTSSLGLSSAEQIADAVRSLADELNRRDVRARALDLDKANPTSRVRGSA